MKGYFPSLDLAKYIGMQQYILDGQSITIPNLIINERNEMYCCMLYALVNIAKAKRYLPFWPSNPINLYAIQPYTLYV